MTEKKPKINTGGQDKKAGSAIKAESEKKPKKDIGSLEFKNEIPASPNQPEPTNEPDDQSSDDSAEEDNGEQGLSEQEGSETLGEQEHEMAMKRQLDQQRKIDADFKAEQEASAEPEKSKTPEKEKQEETAEEEEEEEKPDQPYTPPPGDQPGETAPDQKPDRPDDKNQEEKEADWQRKSVLERANLMRKATMEKDAKKQKEAADEIPEPAKAGPQETLKRVFKGKCFSCTGCIGIIYRFALDYLAASAIYALLDMLWQDDNTDKSFSCNCCCNILSTILLLLSPILIGIGLALLAAKALDSVVDINTIMEFLMPGA